MERNSDNTAASYVFAFRQRWCDKCVHSGEFACPELGNAIRAGWCATIDFGLCANCADCGKTMTKEECGTLDANELFCDACADLWEQRQRQRQRRRQRQQRQ